MALKQQIQNSANEALKSGNKEALGTLRMLLAALLVKEKEKRFKVSKEYPAISEVDISDKSQLTDEEIIGTVSSEIKKRKDAIELYAKGNRPELAQGEEKEIEILKGYLPEQLSESDLRDLIQKSIDMIGAKGVKDMGRVMGDLMPKIKGKADNSQVSKIIKEILEK